LFAANLTRELSQRSASPVVRRPHATLCASARLFSGRLGAFLADARAGTRRCNRAHELRAVL